MSHRDRVSVPVDSSLDERMALLESRFTTPSQAQALHSGIVESSPEEATVLGSSLASQHTFGFDAQSGSHSSGSGVSDASTISNLGKGLVRPKRKRSSFKPLSLDEVNIAAERQIQRVKAKSPESIESNHIQGSHMSNAASNQTILTSHKSSQEESSQKIFVAESPPMLTSHMSPNQLGGGVLTNPKTTKAIPTNDKRKSVPVKREQPSVTVPGNRSSTSSPTSAGSAAKKRTRLNFTSDENHNNCIVSGSKSPKVLTEISTNSRSNPSKSNGRKRLVGEKSRKIDHFFSSVKKNVILERTIPDAQSPPLELAEPAPPQCTSDRKLPELEALRLRCEELEKVLKDKTDQLKAVSNNQTILNSALKASLCRREKELDDLKRSREKDSAKACRIIETLIRAQSSREAKELRQKLASDGARLGRITYTRAGLRTVETWEEGHTSKQLQGRKLDLKSKKQILLERQAIVERAEKALSEGSQVSENLGGLVLDSSLAIMDAKESVRLHLDGILKQENEIEQEEIALEKEKSEHIRSLKRVASEDGSRFRSRPKLNDRYVLVALLGKGGFSEVWRAFDLSELREVAVKIHQLDPRWNEAKKDNYTKHVSREYEIHRAVRHPRIVSLLDVFEIDNNAFATVLECCNGTDLDSLLKEKKRLPERDARAILLQILSGMNYLSHTSGDRQGIIHYDLKPGNILFDEFGDAKITDFGLSKIVDTIDSTESMELTSQGAGTYWYLPPECFITSETVRISNKVDVWSIGVIFYQMLFGKRPFGDGMSQDRVLTDNTMLNAREVQFLDSVVVSNEAKAFIQRCLTYDQTNRPTISQICGDEYVFANLR